MTSFSRGFTFHEGSERSSYVYLTSMGTTVAGIEKFSLALIQHNLLFCI